MRYCKLCGKESTDNIQIKNRFICVCNSCQTTVHRLVKERDRYLVIKKHKIFK